MNIRDRIVEFRRVKANELAPNPKNWRSHPTNQVDALKCILSEVGWASAVLVRETPEGLQLIDGHARTELATDEDIPVLVLDITEQEADLLLATFDPIAAMATSNPEALDELLGSLESDSQALNELIDSLASNQSELQDEVVPCEKFEVILECENETQQQEVYDQMT
jgi:hypothetical protein